VVIEPAAGDFGYALEVGYIVSVEFLAYCDGSVVLISSLIMRWIVGREYRERDYSRSKESSQQIANNTTDTMLPKKSSASSTLIIYFNFVA